MEEFAVKNCQNFQQCGWWTRTTGGVIRTQTGFLRKIEKKGENNPSAGGVPALRMKWAASRYDLLIILKIRNFWSVRMEHPQCGWAHPQPYISLNPRFYHFFAPFHFHNSKSVFLSSKPVNFFPKLNPSSPLPSPLVFSSISHFYSTKP